MRTAREVGGHLGRSAVTSCHKGGEDMADWNERGIMCVKWLNTMKRNPSRLQMNFTGSSVPRIR